MVCQFWFFHQACKEYHQCRHQLQLDSRRPMRGPASTTRSLLGPGTPQGTTCRPSDPWSPEFPSEFGVDLSARSSDGFIADWDAELGRKILHILEAQS